MKTQHTLTLGYLKGCRQQLSQSTTVSIVVSHDFARHDWVIATTSCSSLLSRPKLESCGLIYLIKSYSVILHTHREEKAEIVFTFRKAELCLNVVKNAQTAISLLTAGIVPKQLRRILKYTKVKAHVTSKPGHGGLEGNDAADENPCKLAYRASG